MKVKVYLIVGVLLFQVGVCMIHYGLGLVTLGALFILRSYLYYEKENNEK